MAEARIDAETRTEFGKGAARRTRRAGKIPAVLYGHGTDPVHLTLPGHQTLLALRTANALLNIHVEGDEDLLALPKQVQRDPIKGFIKHVDLLRVRRGEKVTVEVPLEFVGVASPEAIINEERTQLAIQAEITAIPNRIEASIDGMEVGDQLLAGQITLPAGAELEDDPETLILSAVAQISEEALEAELGETEAEEPEVPVAGEEGAEGAEAAEGADSES